MRRFFPTSPKRRETILAVAGFIAFAGALFAIGDLIRALHQAEALYSVGMTGLSIEADLQDYTQESRRVFVYALTTKDPNIQLPYVNAARAADREVNRLHRAFGEIELNTAARRQLQELVSDWTSYVAVRDEMIGLILEDRSDFALMREQAEGAPRFERCVRHLQLLKRLLDQYAKQQLVAVRQTYYRCAIEVCFLILTTVLLIAALRLLKNLRKRNQRLTDSELVERQRSEILESISANLPLESVFAAVLRLVEQRLPTARCIISTVKEGQLCVMSASASLAHDLVATLDGQSIASSSTPSAQAASRGETVVWSTLHEVPGLQACWSAPICGSHRRVLGTLDAYFTGQLPGGADDLRFLERAAQLSALAIEHRLVNDQLAFQAQHDSLTGLPNRAMFQERLDRAIARAAIEHRELAVLWIDLDKFKQVNDALGHHVGDMLLQQVARRLQNCASGNATVARLGGDEFVILLPGCQTAQASVIAKAVLERLNETVAISTHQISVGASIGIALYPEHGDDRETLLRNADTAMYSIKFQGKNMYRVYDSKMGIVSAETLEIERQLRTALELNQFELHYQPQVDSDGRIECIEALLRWNNPVLGPVSPARFIPLAEDNGLIVPLGEWVLREACAQTARWHRLGFSALRIAVNVSAHQFVRSDFADAVARALQDSGLHPRFLELELTETAVMHRPEENIPLFQKLRRLGVRISIDDFGTGNSSLNYLLQLPVDALKIDRSFIDALGRPGRDSLLLIRAIIGMAHGWRLQVVAEGIETPAQLDTLNREGCDLNQGFLLHKPMNAAHLTALLPHAHPLAARPAQLATGDLVAITALAPAEARAEAAI